MLCSASLVKIPPQSSHFKDDKMVHKLGRTLFLIATIVTIPLLLLQAVWLALQSTPLTLAIILATTLLGMILLLMLAIRTMDGMLQHQELRSRRSEDGIPHNSMSPLPRRCCNSCWNSSKAPSRAPIAS